MRVDMHTCMNKETMKHRHLHEYFPWTYSLTPAIAIAIPLARWSVALRPTLLVTDMQTRQLRTVIILINPAGHGDTIRKVMGLWRRGANKALLATGLGRWPRYIVLDKTSGSRVTTPKCRHRSTERALTHTLTHSHSTEGIGHRFFQALYQ
jgi:hypothetical protein